MITLNSGIGNYISLKNKKYSYFAGNDYLGLANHPEVVKEAVCALLKYGVNFSASRKTTGTSDIHLELEQLLSEFKSQEDAIVFVSGYMGNKLLLESLKDQYSVVFADSMAHSSITDGIPNGFSNVSFYNHCDPDHLEKLLKGSVNQRPLIITDGIFALTGEISPIDQIYPLVEKYNGIIIIDDAHATGILGTNGRGTPEHFNLGNAPDIYQSETMSKALGSYGGFLSGRKKFVQGIRNKSSFYGASTALPPAIVAAACSSIKLIRNNPQLREKLIENSELLRNGIQEMGFDTSGKNTPIIPIYFRDKQSAQSLSTWLEDNFIIAPSITYPAKMDKFIVRITVSSIHSVDQIENLLTELKRWRDKHGSYNN